MIIKDFARTIPFLAVLVLGGCKSGGSRGGGTSVPKWDPSDATAVSGSSATPPHSLSPVEYPFDAAGNYLPSMAREGEKRFGGSGASSAPLRSSPSTAIGGGTARKPTSSRSHKVVGGDTLSGLSRKYGVSIAAIKKANGMTSDKLVSGRTLRIP